MLKKDDTLLRVLRGHEEGVNAVKFTKEGNYVMTASEDRTVKLWNPLKDDPSKPSESPEALLIKTYAGVHGYGILDLAISTDNSKFVSAGGDKACFQIDVSTGRTIRRIQAHSHRINSIDMNDESTVLITASYDQTVSVWDLRSNSQSPVQTLKDFTDSVTSVTHSSSAIIAGCVDGFLRIYDLRRGQVHQDYLRDPITSVRLSHDSKCCLTTTLASVIRFTDIRTGSQLQEYVGHAHGLYKLEASIATDDEHVVSGSEDGSIYHWDLLDGKLVKVTPRAHTKSLSSLAFHPTENIFITGSYDGTAKCFKAQY